MSLLQSINDLDSGEYDRILHPPSRLWLSRDHEGELVLTRDGTKIKARYKDLVRGPVAGLRGRALVRAIVDWFDEKEFA